MGRVARRRPRGRRRGRRVPDGDRRRVGRPHHGHRARPARRRRPGTAAAGPRAGHPRRRGVPRVRGPGPPRRRPRGAGRRQLPDRLRPAQPALRRRRRAAALPRLLPRRSPTLPPPRCARSATSRRGRSRNARWPRWTRHPARGWNSLPPAPAALLAEPAGAEAHFAKALADPAGDTWPFERAQLRLDYGEWLRRQRRINDAKPVLTAALETFRRLGAAPWTRRAETELRACGVTAAAAPTAPGALAEPHRTTARDRHPRQPRPDQRRDRRPPVPVAPHRRLTPVPLLPQARHRGPPPAARPARPGHRPARRTSARPLAATSAWADLTSATITGATFTNAELTDTRMSPAAHVPAGWEQDDGSHRLTRTH